MCWTVGFVVDQSQNSKNKMCPDWEEITLPSPFSQKQDKAAKPRWQATLAARSLQSERRRTCGRLGEEEVEECLLPPDIHHLGPFCLSALAAANHGPGRLNVHLSQSRIGKHILQTKETQNRQQQQKKKKTTGLTHISAKLKTQVASCRGHRRALNPRPPGNSHHANQSAWGIPSWPSCLGTCDRTFKCHTRKK